METVSDDLSYQILINDEEQYSLWPAEKKIPLGWKHVYGPNNKEDCLAYVKREWTDMRPLSVRKNHEALAQRLKEQESVKDN